MSEPVRLAADAGTSGMRGRFRAQVQRDVKQEALRQLAGGGPQAVSVNAIAKRLGVSGPALYRYFANRDDLIAALVLDAYLDLAAALQGALDRHAREAPDAQLHALAHAYRRWALDQPHRYGLLFRPPFPGYDAHADDVVSAAHRCITPFFDVVTALPAAGSRPPVPDRLDGQLRDWAERAGRAVDGSVAHLALQAWTRLHGFVDLEIGGNYASLGVDVEQLFEDQVGTLLS